MSINNLTINNYVLITYFALIFVTGTTGNILVLYSFKLKSSSNLTLMELSIAYLTAFGLLASIFSPFNYIYLESSNYTRWDLGPPMCTIKTGVITVLNRHFPKLNYVNFYFYENEAGLDKQTKHFELKREVCLK